MATSHYKTTVSNRGNFNKGGSKIISRYKDGSLVSTKTFRGIPGNQSGGANNQYTTQVVTLDKPSSRSSSRSSSSTSRNQVNAPSQDLSFLILPILAVVAAIIFFPIWGCYKLYKLYKEKQETKLV